MKKSNVVAICVFCVLSVTAGYLWQNRSVQTPSQNWEFKKAVIMKNVHPHARSIASVPDLQPLFTDLAIGYVFGHALINKFDRCLKSEGAPSDCAEVTTAENSGFDGYTNTQIYTKILAHRSIMEDLEHVILDVYKSNVMAVVEQIKNGGRYPQLSVEESASGAQSEQQTDSNDEDSNVATSSSEPLTTEAQFLQALGQFMDKTATIRSEIRGVSVPVSEQAYLFGISRLAHKQEELKQLVLSIQKALEEEKREPGKTTAEISQINLANEFLKNEILNRINNRSTKYEQRLQLFNEESASREAEAILDTLGVNAENMNDKITQAANQIIELRSKPETARSPDSADSPPPFCNITGNSFPQGVWSMTYDDGPVGTTTANSPSLRILENLQSAGVKASFFMLAKQVVDLEDTAKEIKDAGMEIALHSYTHRDIGVTVTRKLNNESTPSAPETLAAFLEKEITTSKNDIEHALDIEHGSDDTITNFRLPYGSGMSTANRRNGTVLVSARARDLIRDKIANAGMKHIFWNVDSLDWQDTNPITVSQRVREQVARRRGGIILYHDIHPQSVISSNTIIREMLREGKQFKTIKEIVGTGSACP